MLAVLFFALNILMNIEELKSYNLADAVKFHDHLNPLLWDKQEHLHPEIKDQLLAIAADFSEFLGVKDLELKDITISGSNAAYSYTPHSDIDLHLIVDLSNEANNEVYRELFDAKKFIYNSENKITIKGIPVELYVQDAGQAHHSQGIYSILNNNWIQVPRRKHADIDDMSVRSKYRDLSKRIREAIKTNSTEKMSEVMDKIRALRQTGLAEHGEFGAENLAFKLLRNKGDLEKLAKARKAAKSQELSLKERERTPTPVIYGYKSDRDYIDEVGITPDGTDPSTCEFTNEGQLNEVGITPDGTDPSTCEFTNENDNNQLETSIIDDFVKFCIDKLKLDNPPKLRLRRDPTWSQRNKTFGRFNPQTGELEVAVGSRHIMDTLRTLAHELTHQRQHETIDMPDTAGETGSEFENEANARAGIIMRDYGSMHPELFTDNIIDVDEGYGASTPAGEKIVKWQQDKLAGKEFAIQGYRIKFTDKGLLIFKGADLVFKKPGDYSNPTNLDMTKARRYITNLSRNWKPDPIVNEATGYIPTAAEADDPRFEMALTVDIRPGALGKNANKLLLDTDSQGRPQELRPNGIVHRMMEELELFKRN